MTPRPNQEYALAELPKRIAAGFRRIIVTSPTGGGKSLVAMLLCSMFRRVVLYSNRKILTEQVMRGMDSHGIEYGIQAAGYERTGFENVQVAQIQTVSKRFETGKMDLHDADLVIIDEAHAETGKRAELLINEHVKRGAVVVGLTATPIGLDGLYDDLIVAGTTSELRAIGALVPAHTYAPDEPDLRAFKAQKIKGLLQLHDRVKEIMLPVMFGRVKQHALIFNPELKPAILFAMSVETSQWFAERLWSCNIPSAHIDADRIWINGETLEASRENRQVLREASESGRVKIVSNRFVLREGIDWPFLYHGIFTCTFGSVAPYLQAGGRLLRAHPSLDHVIAQDHGGNYWRHDSLNADRKWSLDLTDNKITGERVELFKTKKLAEPVVCPNCKRARPGGSVTCPNCGHVIKTRSRIVIQIDGTLKEMKGDIFRERRYAADSDKLRQAWVACVMRSRAKNKTLAQARGLFQYENNWLCPQPDWPYMPANDKDWYRKVADLYPKRSA